MNKELIDKAWACLPKEFKLEVEFEYHRAATKARKEEYDLGFMHAHEGMFGLHNLTSDAEGEEMLTCEKSKAMHLYSHLLDLVENERMSEHYSGWCDLEREYIALFGENVFADYFGSKCLPDEEPKPAEPKFKVGDKVRVCSKDAERYGKIGEVIQVYPSGVVDIDFGDGYVGGHFYGAWAIEPYTEPTANYVQVDYHGADTAASTIADSCQSQPVTDCHDFNHIVNRGFCDHNRLHIAAMAMQGILANSHQGMVDMKIDKVAELAIAAADKLIAECKKGGENE